MTLPPHPNFGLYLVALPIKLGLELGGFQPLVECGFANLGLLAALSVRWTAHKERDRPELSTGSIHSKEGIDSLAECILE